MSIPSYISPSVRLGTSEDLPISQTLLNADWHFDADLKRFVTPASALSAIDLELMNAIQMLDSAAPQSPFKSKDEVEHYTQLPKAFEVEVKDDFIRVRPKSELERMIVRKLRAQHPVSFEAIGEKLWESYPNSLTYRISRKDVPDADALLIIGAVYPSGPDHIITTGNDNETGYELSSFVARAHYKREALVRTQRLPIIVHSGWELQADGNVVIDPARLAPGDIDLLKSNYYVKSSGGKLIAQYNLKEPVLKAIAEEQGFSLENIAHLPWTFERIDNRNRFLLPEMSLTTLERTLLDLSLNLDPAPSKDAKYSLNGRVCADGVLSYFIANRLLLDNPLPAAIGDLAKLEGWHTDYTRKMRPTRRYSYEIDRQALTNTQAALLYLTGRGIQRRDSAVDATNPRELLSVRSDSDVGEAIFEAMNRRFRDWNPRDAKLVLHQPWITGGAGFVLQVVRPKGCARIYWNHSCRWRRRSSTSATQAGSRHNPAACWKRNWRTFNA